MIYKNKKLKYKLYKPYKYLSKTMNDKKLIQRGIYRKIYREEAIKLNYVVGADNGSRLLFIPAQIGMWENYKKVMINLKIFSSKHSKKY